MIPLAIQAGLHNHVSMEKPLLKSYLNVSKFLQDYYWFRKATENPFSYQTWAAEMGIENRAYLRLVVSGKRPLNEVLSNKIMASLELADNERSYFLALVNYTQSKNSEQRRVFGMQLARHFDSEVDQQEIQGHFEFTSNPLMPKLQTLLSFSDFPSTTAEMALIADVSEAEIVVALNHLEALGLASRTLVGDQAQWQPTQRSWKVASRFKDLGLREFYRNSLKRAEAAIDLPLEDRRFRSLFVAMDQNEYQDFLSDFEVFVRDQLKKRDVDTIKNRRLFQLNFNFFAETKN